MNVTVCSAKEGRPRRLEDRLDIARATGPLRVPAWSSNQGTFGHRRHGRGDLARVLFIDGNQAEALRAAGVRRLSRGEHLVRHYADVLAISLPVASLRGSAR
jgi:hypothetical protein